MNGTSSWPGKQQPGSGGEMVTECCHGSSLCDLVRHLESLSEVVVMELDLPIGIPLVCELDKTGSLSSPGTIKESGAKHKGLIEIPNLSEENEVDDTEVNVSKKKGDGDILKDLMKTAGIAKVREALGEYLKALKTEFTTGMILPTKAVATQELTVKRKLRENTLQASSPVALGVRIPTVALHMTELFDTTADQLYGIFTVKDLVQKFSKSPAVLEAEKGGKFQMFDGNITGEYIELLTNRKIIMKWRCRNWPEAIFFPEHYATVALNFVPTLGQTELQLDCKGVPVCKEENMKYCWQKQHFEEIKGLLQLNTLKSFS
ncbi:activator of 90 kDa heat shock protein ATPase homolog 2 isoform X4 [Castor canadensis]|uniref:Activator of 90 kDa heat shock protein ATPase homolog 2 isoform X4 n=2 Tax=Castor canadensis TaxID=51338 RepID=A0AC58KLU7_CASCN